MATDICAGHFGVFPFQGLLCLSGSPRSLSKVGMWFHPIKERLDVTVSWQFISPICPGFSRLSEEISPAWSSECSVSDCGLSISKVSGSGGKLYAPAKEESVNPEVEGGAIGKS